MSSLYAVVQRLKDEDWEPFHALILDRRTTTDDAHEWLKGRGYGISRSAVGNYINAARKGSLFKLRLQIGAGGDDDVRQKLTKIAERLDGAELLSVALYASYLVNVATVTKGTDPEPSEGLERVPPPSC
ncbi:MAG: hypothetical protein H0U59_10125 [Gemmatimonadaceae bacterium]|nr:hypothetical protein [Gemmatimonadaceae bacterium]